MVWLKPENLTDICWHFQIFAASSDICGHHQISPTHQTNIDLSHGIYRKPAAAARHTGSLAYEAQVCLTLAGPGRTGSRPVICRSTWALANTGQACITSCMSFCWIWLSKMLLFSVPIEVQGWWLSCLLFSFGLIAGVYVICLKPLLKGGFISGW